MHINKTQPSGSAVKLGVSLGSILGLVLFLLYLNDLPHLPEQKCKIILFADDTSLIFKINRQQNDQVILMRLYSLLHLASDL